MSRSRPAPSPPTQPGTPLPGTAQGGPTLTVTRHDRAAAAVLAAVLSLGLTAVFLTAVWGGGSGVSPPDPVPLELLSMGGVADGAENETLDLKTPFEDRPDASLAQLEAETTLEPVLESVVDLADKATDMAQRQPQTAAVNAGVLGSRSGTGAAGLGSGPGDGGLPREQRWFVSFAEGGGLDRYARQLDQFGIELAAVEPGGRVVYLSNLGAPRPTLRRAEPAAATQETRLHMAWQGGGRRKADLDLFQKAAVNPGGGPLLHFYPPATEERLARLERDYLQRAGGNRTLKEIRRTYFIVIDGRGGFDFTITRQTYFR